MAKLTKKEIEVLANSIMNQVNKKQEDFKNSEEFLEALDAVKEEYSYDELEVLASEISTLDTRMSEIILRRQVLVDAIKSSVPRANYYGSGKPKLDKFIEVEAMNKFKDRFPKFGEIESEIILLSISGSEDILDAIKSKFELD